MHIVNPTYRPDSLPLQAILETPAFLKLNAKHRTFVVAYIDGAAETGQYDAVGAIKHTYGAATKNPELRAYQILRNRKIAAVLDIHFRRSELDTLLADLKRAAKKSLKLKLLTPAAVRALKAFEKYVQKEQA